MTIGDVADQRAAGARHVDADLVAGSLVVIAVTVAMT